MAPGLHHLEAWNEAVCDGAWGRPAAWVAERVRQALDLEHWAAFHDSFVAMCLLLREVGAGRRGEPPASIVALSGDVHHAYLARVGFLRGSGVVSNVWQATCSPFRNPLSTNEQRAVRFNFSRPGIALGRALARAAGVPDPPVRWRFQEGDPRFDNQVATLEIDGRRARMVLERSLQTAAGPAHPRLERVAEHPLT